MLHYLSTRLHFSALSAALTVAALGCQSSSSMVDMASGNDLAMPSEADLSMPSEADLAMPAAIDMASPPTDLSKALTSITVGPANPLLYIGGPAQLTATGNFSDGSTQDLTASAQWASSDVTKVTVAGGKVTMLKLGGAITITATDAASGIRGTLVLPARPVVFGTSVSGTGNLSSWADAGGKSGLAAGDAICQSLAGKVGLSGNFVAFLSDDKDDAYCRLHGLGGKVSAKCGQATLPATAGPWVRSDGYPFNFGPLSQLSANVYVPLSLDQTGTQVVNSTLYFTGTSSSGAVSPASPCANWTSGATAQPLIGGGYPAQTVYWATGSGFDCSSKRSLICFQAQTGPAQPIPAATGQRVFVTSASGNGQLSTWAQAGGATGIAAGDAICQKLAKDAGLSSAGKFKAWLSNDTGPVNAVDRLTSNGPWVRLDGVPVAASRAALTSSSTTAWLFTTINLTEKLVYDANLSAVLTGTGAGAAVAGGTCSGWTSTSGNSPIGADYTVGNPGWTSAQPWPCANGSKLYCFEDN